MNNRVPYVHHLNSVAVHSRHTHWKLQAWCHHPWHYSVIFGTRKGTSPVAKDPKVVYLVVATVGMGMILGSKFGKGAGLYQSISTGSRESV